MKRYLVVANQTLGGEHLIERVRRFMADGPCRFHIVVPATPPGEQLTWTEGEAAAIAQARLDRGLERFRALGAEADGEVVSAGWAVYEQGTEFAGLWGGSTLAEWRGKGIYKALVTVRAVRAVELGYKYLQVDASDDSSPILQRLGFVAVTSTTPWVYTPA